MKNKLFTILLLTFIFASNNGFATVDYLVVNHLTKQLYWAETDNPLGWIGWTGVGEIYETKEQKYLDIGYTYTKNPFVIEEIIVLIIILSLLFYWLIRKRKNALQHGL